MKADGSWCGLHRDNDCDCDYHCIGCIHWVGPVRSGCCTCCHIIGGDT